MTGEVHILVGGRMELYACGEMFRPVWISGHMVAKARYTNKYERRKIIDKALELLHEIEVKIIPDDIIPE